MLALRRRTHRHPARRARQRHRLPDEADRSAILLRRALRDAEMLDLRIVEHLIDVVDRPARHAGLVENLDPLGARLLFGVSADLLVELLAVLRAQLTGRIIRMPRHAVGAERIAEA